MKILRVTTVPESLTAFCSGLLRELREEEGYDVVAVSSPGEDLDKIGASDSVRSIAVPMKRHISPLSDIRSLWRMIRVFRREKPDMVHSMTPKAGLVSMMAARLCRVPVRVHTFTGLVFPTSKGLTRKLLMATDRLTCACATHIIPEGEGVKQDLQTNKITKKPLKVLGYGNVRGIDLKHYDPEQFKDLKSDDGVTSFVFIGRLVGDKGINELVEAFKRLNLEYPSTRLILVGPGEPELDPLKPDTLAEIERNPAIQAVGSQKDVRPWLAQSDILVFPSYREGFPNVVIEAGAMGLPSIVTDINGSREIIVDGHNGVIVPPRDAQALYTAMRDMLNDTQRREQMAAQARPLIASRFEQSFVRQCLKDYYKEILARQSR